VEVIMKADPPDDGCANGHQARDLRLNVGGPGGDRVTPGCDIEVQVEAVLDRLGLCDLLEVQHGAGAPGIA
jgi:hypothetical protein